MDESISATKWIKEGDLIINRDGLNYKHPESWWQLWKDKYNEELPYDVAVKIYPDMSYRYYEDIVSGKLHKDYYEEQRWNYT